MSATSFPDRRPVKADCCLPTCRNARRIADILYGDFPTDATGYVKWMRFLKGDSSGSNAALDGRSLCSIAEVDVSYPSPSASRYRHRLFDEASILIRHQIAQRLVRAPTIYP